MDANCAGRNQASDHPIEERDAQMEAFANTMRESQTAWRRKHLENQERGWHDGRQYDHILPANCWEMNLWHGIRSESTQPLPQYLTSEHIKKHTSSDNLCSSWIVCANLYFPFRKNQKSMNLLGSFLKEKVHRDVESVTEMHLEFAAEDENHPQTLLGETGGKRGSGQTSPDMAFVIKTQNSLPGLILVESKFCEHSFYPCSGRTKRDTNRPANPDPSRCLNTRRVLEDYPSQCHLVKWGRRYWDHLSSVIKKDKAEKLTCCPAATAGYQLFRQQALAEGIARSGVYEPVVSAVAYDERNRDIVSCLKHTGIEDFTVGWAKLFDGKARFATFTHQSWVDWVKKHDQRGEWANWLDYIVNRYEL